MTHEELEYRQKYSWLPTEQDELLQYLEDNLRLDMNKIAQEEERIKSIPWEEIEIRASIVPKGTPRPRTSSVTGRFYVKGAKKTHKYFERIIQEKKIICTRVEYTLTIYIPTPSSMTNTEKYLAEKGVIWPTNTPDWDNIAKTYTDCLQGVLLLNDNIVNPGHVYRYWSIRPRIVINLRYQTQFESNYHRRKAENSVAYKQYEDSGYQYNDGAFILSGE